MSRLLVSVALSLISLACHAQLIPFSAWRTQVAASVQAPGTWVAGPSAGIAGAQNPPTAESFRSVWSGREMLNYGGTPYVGASTGHGFRYIPATNSFLSLSMVNDPGIRFSHTQVWTGTEMLIWGGNDGVSTVYGTGVRYNPTADKWTSMSMTGAPVARDIHSGVWTGSKLIVWGGADSSGTSLNSGGVYDPATDSWTAMSTLGAPTDNSVGEVTAVWTGSKMIVYDYSSGLRHAYTPSTNSWSTISNTGAPNLTNATAVWTGNRMFVWGGYDSVGNPVNSGGLYDPSSDTWSIVTTTNAPESRKSHQAVWTGSKVLIYGGLSTASSTELQTGSLYDPSTNTWTSMSTASAPSSRYRIPSMWMGNRFLVYSGYSSNGTPSDSGAYDPATNTWSSLWSLLQTSASAPAPRVASATVSTGSKLILWGGADAYGMMSFGDGGVYDPVTNAWVPITSTNAPIARHAMAAVWTGSEMFMWGGANSAFGNQNDGYLYDPAADAWTSLAAQANSPTDLFQGTAVLAGSKVIVWGGKTGSSDGGVYDLTAQTWSSISSTGAPTATRIMHYAVWTGSRMLVGGGFNTVSANVMTDGWQYDPNTDTWTAISGSSGLGVILGANAAWSGTALWVWDGFSRVISKYQPSMDTWTVMSSVNSPVGNRLYDTAVCIGSKIFVFGGADNSLGIRNDGGIYDIVGDSWAPLTQVNAPLPRYLHNAFIVSGRMLVQGGYVDSSTLATIGDLWLYAP